MRRPWPALGRSATGKKVVVVVVCCYYYYYYYYYYYCPMRK
jgi:hypothetical protein